MKISNRTMEYLFGFISMQVSATAENLNIVEMGFQSMDALVQDYQSKRDNIVAPNEGLAGKLKNYRAVDIEDEKPENDDEMNENIRKNKAIILETEKAIDEINKSAISLAETETEIPFSDEFKAILKLSVASYLSENRPNDQRLFNGVTGRIHVKCMDEIVNALA